MCLISRRSWTSVFSRLSEELKATQAKREDIDEEIKKKSEYLDSLQPMLNEILQVFVACRILASFRAVVWNSVPDDMTPNRSFHQATKPVQEYLKMPFDETRDQHRAAMYLPRPLYVLYMQGSAYKDACGGFSL